MQIQFIPYLQEVFDLLGIIVVAFTTDTFHLTDVTSSACSLDILEVNQRILAQVDNGTEIIIQSCRHDICKQLGKIINKTALK
jgi:hypothetical protein